MFHYQCHKINLKRCGSYIDSPDWIKTKNATINHINYDEEYSKEPKILEFNQYQKYDNTPYFVYADLESLIKRVGGCKESSEKSSTAKVGEQIPCRFQVLRYGHLMV